MRHKAMAIAVVLACQLGLAGAAAASETITYNYDALGRLVTVQHSGGLNNGLAASYALDPADNRTAVTVSGSPFSEPSEPVVVIPLRAGRIIVAPAT